MRTIEAVGFDLGETLLFYQETPLSWAALYEPALAAVAGACGLSPSKSEVAAACATLRAKNTRITPRERELTADEIFKEVLAAWHVSAPTEILNQAVKAFFGFFQQRMCAYEDTKPVLHALRKRELPLGILTDVPYGMPASFVRDDLRTAGIEEFFAVVLTSGEVGWRKPATAGFVALAERLGTVPARMLYVGNEAKDVIGAARAGACSILLDREQRSHELGEHASIRCLTELLSYDLR